MRGMDLLKRFGMGAAALAMCACGAESTESEGGEGAAEPEVIGKGSGKEDAWDYRNNPQAFSSFANKNFEYDFAKLPKTGKAASAPWPDTYWPTYQDSTNVRWRQGDLSALEKYDLVFNDWTMPEGFRDLKPFDPSNCQAGFSPDYYRKLGPAAKWMSENKGNKAARDLVYRDGAETPVCDEKVREAVETWWGLCHAWAPAAINEPEPIHPVTIDGVTFYAADIKALVQTVYDSSKSMILGGRCNTKQVERDETGRIKEDACRDANAGAFHVVMANMLGRYSMPILEDRTFDYQVWNQPVYSFTVEQATEVDLKKAHELLRVDPTLTTYKYNAAAKRFVEVFAKVQYVTESHATEEPVIPEIESYLRTDNYHYLLELDDAGKILGGEWLQGRAAHPTWGVSEQPDFLWYSIGPNTQSFGRSNPYVDYRKVKELLEKSRTVQPEDPADPAARFSTQIEPGAAIPDNDPAGVSSQISVDDARVATRVFINVDITHTYVGDLEIELKKGDFAKVLRRKEGGSADDLHTQFEVPELAGQSLQGGYTLIVRDLARIDTGKVVRWGVTADVQ